MGGMNPEQYGNTNCPKPNLIFLKDSVNKVIKTTFKYGGKQFTKASQTLYCPEMRHMLLCPCICYYFLKCDNLKCHCN